MSITTRSQWYYGHEITSLNQSLDFDEGGSEIQATLNIGTYTLTEFASEVERALNAAGGQVYTVSVTRSTRIITISASSNFSLLVSSGSRTGTGVWSLLGFTGSDQTGSNSYSGDSGSGSRYRPQAILMDYMPFDDAKRFVKASINESASGEIETLSFGTRQFMECNIHLITDLTQTANSPSETDNNARSNARDFLDYAIKKAKMEFMEDRDTPGTYVKCLLESTSSERDGTGYELKKMFPAGVPGYYETGKLVFRKVN